MSLFKTQLITVVPKAPGTLVNSRWVQGNDASYDIYGSVQPASGSEVQSLPEGKREKTVLRIYCDTSVKLNAELDTRTPDVVIIDSVTYSVYARVGWSNNLISHKKYIVTEV